MNLVQPFLQNVLFAKKQLTKQEAQQQNKQQQTNQVFQLKHYAKLFLTKSVCDGAINEFAKTLIINLAAGKLDSEWLCGKLDACEDVYKNLDFDDFAKEVLKDKPTNIKMPQPTLKKTFKVLHLTDIHFDGDYQDGQNMNCEKPLCCRNDSILSNKTSDKAGYWGSLSKCDIPLRTVEQAMVQMRDEIKPDMIIWTGDNIQHNVWNQFQKNQTVNTKVLTDMVKEYFPQTPIYPIFGNHECYGVDQFDFYGNQSDWLKQETSSMWKSLLDDQAYQSLLKNSYYSIYNKEFNIKTIVLNTQSCDSINFFAFNDSTDLGSQLKWFRNELYEAETSLKQVFVIGHIPPGDSGCNYKWGQRYQVIAERFSHIIRGQFFGHTHNDQLEVQKSYVGAQPVGTIFISPSLTTYSNYNPSFRYFEVDQETNIITNYYQYRLNLTKANLQSKDQKIIWDLAYDFKSMYNLKDLSPQSIGDFVNQLGDNKKDLKNYIKNFYLDGPDGDVSTKYLNSKKYIVQYTCPAQNQNFLEVIKCQGFDSIYDPVTFFIILQWIDGNWQQRIQ